METLPPEVLQKIFSYLGDKDLIRISGVSQTWKKVSQTHCLWKTLWNQNLNLRNTDFTCACSHACCGIIIPQNSNNRQSHNCASITQNDGGFSSNQSAPHANWPCPKCYCQFSEADVMFKKYINGKRLRSHKASKDVLTFDEPYCLPLTCSLKESYVKIMSLRKNWAMGNCRKYVQGMKSDLENILNFDCDGKRFLSVVGLTLKIWDLESDPIKNIFTMEDCNHLEEVSISGDYLCVKSGTVLTVYFCRSDISGEKTDLRSFGESCNQCQAANMVKLEKLYGLTLPSTALFKLDEKWLTVECVTKFTVHDLSTGQILYEHNVPVGFIIYHVLILESCAILVQSEIFDNNVLVVSLDINTNTVAWTSTFQKNETLQGRNLELLYHRPSETFALGHGDFVRIISTENGSLQAELEFTREEVRKVHTFPLSYDATMWFETLKAAKKLLCPDTGYFLDRRFAMSRSGFLVGRKRSFVYIFDISKGSSAFQTKVESPLDLEPYGPNFGISIITYIFDDKIVLMNRNHLMSFIGFDFR